ncbi:MAG: Dam family site-specific DNA-(adenine-N6)-methyltransferase [gamma proteobacterium symbiont of Taylorina sp.]|nr:Dam family site-specific DNA-(adenine-N6)-methyltransferase [gamma proteobacterium symbiont of Taylorina sp.]
MKNKKKPITQTFLKWAGNKRKIIHEILPLLPEGKRLIEPFCGSAAVFLNTNYKKNIISDTNSDLINIFLHLQNEKQEFIEYCRIFFIDENNTADKYYKFREQFNQTKDKKLRAALFLYLNKHCFNGLCRYNLKGGFNVPFGRYKRILLPEDNMITFIKKSQQAEFLLSDFSDSMRNAGKGDIIYCDPPYVPVNDSNSSFKYEKGGFSLEQQTLIATLAEECAERGISVLISNHLTNFTREIYKNSEMTEISVQRTISCNAEKRVKASEVLALYKP